MDHANRAYNHGFHRDYIVRSLLDTDFYKLLMLQLIWKHFQDAEVTFALKNRTKSVILPKEVDVVELREQLDHVRTLRFQSNEIAWLRGQSFYGQWGLFCEDFLRWLADFQLGEYDLRVSGDDLVLEFPGKWAFTTLWEIPSLTITNELRYRTKLAQMSRSELRVMYARATAKQYAKLERLKELPNLNLTDFGTRRRHSFLWQEDSVLMACEVLGNCFTGSSNAYLCFKHGLEAKGTNAHELPMAVAAMMAKENEGDPEAQKAALKVSQYVPLDLWQKTYRGGLQVFLPDTFGTTQFLKDAPDWLPEWRGARPDSKPPIEAGDELIAWWKEHGQDPREKLIIPSDGLDVKIDGYEAQGSDIPEIYNHFYGRVGLGFGWGTMLTNDFIGCHPAGPTVMKPLSLVCKVKEANGRPAVKLSDNYEKATGPEAEVELYRKTFGYEGMTDVPVVV